MHHRLLIVVQSKSSTSPPAIEIVYYDTEEAMLRAYKKINQRGGSDSYWIDAKMLDFPKED
ncbi:MAG TPA: hypothetical protein VJN02_03150 [Gammaproteobacteria bacterium]|nr:hypothetical protein [Gammaproteobacteria bacterium]